MTDIFRRAWNWCCRFRHRCGYGVHSPSDFHFITFVIYERLPFYAYTPLHRLRRGVLHLPHYREKVDRLLFRVVNERCPSALLEVGTGSGLSALYMASANLQMKVRTLDQKYQEKVARLFGENSRITYEKCELKDGIEHFLSENHCPDLIHIAHTPYYKEVFDLLLPKVKSETCMIIGQPYATAEKKLWWKEVVADERTGVTFDLYDVGLVFFDKSRVKEHRIVNFL